MDDDSDLDEWRRDFEANLTKEYGWLSLVGLYWLEGETAVSLGSAPDNDFVLAGDPALPPRIGKLHREGQAVVLEPEPGVAVNVNGVQTDGPARLRLGDEKESQFIGAGALRLFPIKRGDRWGIRARSPHSTYRSGFKDLTWAPATVEARIATAYESWTEPRPLGVVNLLGEQVPAFSVGKIHFRWQGKNYAFDAEKGKKGGLFVNFKDGGNGKLSYPGGRFLYTDVPSDGSVILDFNRAINPPCSRTPYAVCPRPPQANVLQGVMEAGELYHCSVKECSSSLP
jgi:hypothetical protein